MYQAKTVSQKINFPERLNLLAPAVGLMILALLVGFVYLILEGNLESPFPNSYLFPWIFLTAAAIIAPSLYLIYKKQFTFYNPIVYAAMIFFFPAFVGGGIILAGGWNQAYFLNFIDEPEYTLPLTMVYVAIGYLGLSIGFFLPVGRKIGESLNRKMPVWEWSPSQLIAPALILVGVGLFFNLSALIGGILGFQRLETIGTFDALQYFLTTILVEASFLLWMIIFKSPKRDFRLNFLLVSLIALIPFRTVILGSRSTLLLSVVMIFLAFTMSGRKLKARQSALLGIFVVVALLGGIIYGTTFRIVKGSESQVGIGDYIDSVGQTFDTLERQGVDKTMNEALYNLAERVDATSSLAVVVANYEKLAPYEAAYGLENNIWNYTWTAFIPRFVWNDKPVVSDAHAYSDLYFNFSENSFAMTAIGDLLRNFGPVGIPLGMALLGFVLRIIYAALVENRKPQIWQSMAYYMFLTIVTYEGFYGIILPLLLRVGLIVLASVIFIRFYIGSGKKIGYSSALQTRI